MSKEPQCPPDFVRFGHKIAGQLADCGLKCMVFQKKEKEMAATVVVIFGALTLVSSLFTLITAALDLSRFQYPERAIVHLSICYASLAIGYIAGVINFVYLYFVGYFFFNNFNLLFVGFRRS